MTMRTMTTVVVAGLIIGACGGGDTTDNSDVPTPVEIDEPAADDAPASDADDDSAADDESPAEADTVADGVERVVIEHDGGEVVFEGASVCLTSSEVWAEFNSADFSERFVFEASSDGSTDGVEISMNSTLGGDQVRFLQLGGNLDGTSAGDAASVEYQLDGTSISGTATLIDTDTRFEDSPATVDISFAIEC